MKEGIVCLVITLSSVFAYAQNVGIGTNVPQARLHVSDSSVVFTGSAWNVLNPVSNTPISGSGTRMMWYVGRAAFRVGAVSGDNWDKDSIGNYSFASGLDSKAIGTYSTSMGLRTSASGNYSTSIGYETIARGQMSTSMGLRTTASGNNSTSMGFETTASGGTSTSMGYLSNARGSYSTSIGFETNANGYGSTSMGMRTSAGGEASISMGLETSASGHGSTSMGQYTSASAPGATSMGLRTTASATNSTSMGYESTASGHTSTSMGYQTIASGNFSTSIGLSTRAKAFASFSVGKYNDDTDNPLYNEGATDRIFQIGNGTDVARSNALTVLRNGNIGIGTVTPSVPLSFANTFGTKISLYHGTYGDVGIGIYGGELRLQNDIPNGKVSLGVIETTSAYTELAKAERNGAISFSVNGSLWANGTVYASDARFKQNIIAISSPLQKILQIIGVEYEMRVDEFSQNHFVQGRQIGLLAQNVEMVIPEAVSEKDGYKGVDYGKLVPLLIEGIKEQQKQIATSTDEVEKLKQQVAELKKIVEQLVKK